MWGELIRDFRGLLLASDSRGYKLLSFPYLSYSDMSASLAANRRHVLAETLQGVSHFLVTPASISPGSTLRQLGATVDIEQFTVPIDIFQLLCVRFEICRTHELERAYYDALEERTILRERLASQLDQSADESLTIEELADSFMQAYERCVLRDS